MPHYIRLKSTSTSFSKAIECTQSKINRLPIYFSDNVHKTPVTDYCVATIKEENCKSFFINLKETV